MAPSVSYLAAFQEAGRTTSEGIPSTRINRRNFLVASSTSADERVFDALLYLSRILLNECAAATAEDSVAEDMRPRGRRS